VEALGAKVAGDLALQGAGWAIAILLGIVILLLLRELKGAYGVVSDVKVAIQANTSASTANSIALEGIRSTLEVRGQAVEGLSRQLEGVEKSFEQQSDWIRERQTEILNRLSGGRS
jgi:hypothetical protein